MVVIGAKGFAKELYEDLYKKYDKIFFFDNVSQDLNEKLFGCKIITSINELSKKLKKDPKFVIGVGNPRTRKKLWVLFTEHGGKPINTVSVHASIGNFQNEIGAGTNIMAGTRVTNDIRIGRGCLINLNCTIGHDSIIGEFVELSPGVKVSGHCNIGSFSSIGTNAVIIPKVNIGKNVTIGAGAVVTKDIPDNSLAVGIPAKVIKNLDPLEFD